MVEFSALHLNAHWFNGTAMLGAVPLPLVHHDLERAREAARRIRLLRPDFILLNEVWCPEVADVFMGEINHRTPLYPHRVNGPVGPGLNRLLDEGGMASRRVQVYTRLLDRTASHFPKTASWVTGHTHWATRFVTGGDAILRSGLLHLFGPSESLLEVVLNRFIGKQVLWGAGLMIASRFRLFNRRFVSFRGAVGLERLTRKGALKVQTKLPIGRRLTLVTAHLHEGDSIAKTQARWSQIEQLAGEVRSVRRAPTIFMGDLNLMSAARTNGRWEPTPEYTAVLHKLGLRDAFRHDQITYDGTTPFAKRMAWLERDRLPPYRRIDYGLYDGSRMEVVSADVVDEFRDLTDHKALLVRFRLAG